MNDRRILEIIYMDYLDEIENPVEIDTKPIINKEIEKKIIEKFKEPKKEKKIEIPPIQIGNIYLFFKGHIPIYYLVIEELDDLYEVLKVSNYYELGNQNDMIIKIGEDIFIVETWNNFYLTEEEIKNSIFIGKLSKEDFKLLRDFIDGKIKELPKEKRGLTVPLNENFYQIKFHKKESQLVREYKMRIFTQEENYIELPPEKLKSQPLAAAEEEKSYTGENFTLFLDEKNKVIVLEPLKEIVGKPAIIRIFDDEYETESIPEQIYLDIPDEITDINLSYIGENISIEVKS